MNYCAGILLFFYLLGFAAGHGVAVTPENGNATEPAPGLVPQPVEVPPITLEVRERYALGLVMQAPADLQDDHIRAVTLAAKTTWKHPLVQIAWYAAEKKKGQGVMAVGECGGGLVRILRATSPAEAKRLELSLGFVTTPAELSRAYLENEVAADDDFRGKPVIFESTIADIARGAFNRPYVFFPGEVGAVTGLTCYFPGNDPSLRRIRKGAVVTVRGTVKGFLMQDVLLDECDVISVNE